MNTQLQQVLTIARLEFRRAFFSKRAFWVYFLAFFPALIFGMKGFGVRMQEQRWDGRKTAPELVDSIRDTDTYDEIKERLGKPLNEWSWEDDDKKQARVMYYDGRRRVTLRFEEGKLTSRRSQFLRDVEQDKLIFAGVFQYFYLRLAIFFGCLGIFMNLFRGEMLDKTLHYWFLVPAKRETLLAGKYLAGLVAAIVIFGAGAVAATGGMMWGQFPSDAAAYWNSDGASHLVKYLLAVVVACLGYGSVFLAAGLLVKNPMAPAITILLWEGANGFLPAMLQKLSVLYYAQSLCPIPAPMDEDTPALARLLLAPAEPASTFGALFGVLCVTALVMVAASYAVRRLEINYSTE